LSFVECESSNRVFYDIFESSNRVFSTLKLTAEAEYERKIPNKIPDVLLSTPNYRVNVRGIPLRSTTSIAFCKNETFPNLVFFLLKTSFLERDTNEKF